MIGSLLVVGWVAYNFLKNRRQPIFFHFPMIGSFPKAAALSRAQSADQREGTLYSIAAERSEGTAAGSIENKGNKETRKGGKKWIQRILFAFSLNEMVFRAFLIAWRLQALQFRFRRNP